MMSGMGDDNTYENGSGGASLVGNAEVVRAAFDAMPTMMAVLEGPEHRLVAANRVWRTLVDRPFLDQPAREVLPDIAGQQLFELLDNVYASGEPVTAREWRIQFQTEQGEPFEVFLDFTLAPWLWDDGRVRGVLVSQADVTERVRQRQAEQARTAEAERRYEAARDVVAELQQVLLPTGLPVLPQASVAARYLVAARDQAAGGDWFDAVALPGGALALVVGDIVGHGVAASAAMGQPTRGAR